MPTPTIPVQNIYYLLSYAWDALPEAQVIDVSRIPPNDLPGLFAHVLCGGVEHVARRGLERGYEEIEAELTRIRGRVMLAESHARGRFEQGRAICVADELTVNTLPNRIIKATLGRLARIPELDPGQRHRLLASSRRLGGIEDIRIDGSVFRRVRLHANNRYYRFLLNICALVHDLCLVDEASGHDRFREFLRDERRMAKLFQQFVYNFYRLERTDATVRAEQIKWRVTVRDGEKAALKYLPLMRTDICIGLGKTKLVVDTKYYRETLGSYFDAESIHSGHLYQLLAYLSNADLGGHVSVEGMLLYPVVSKHLRLDFESLQGFRIRVCTVNLAANWMAIRQELLDILHGRRMTAASV
jgi:5-methylcytosine-specific restriction enzyme subunit McrC